MEQRHISSRERMHHEIVSRIDKIIALLSDARKDSPVVKTCLVGPQKPIRK